MHIGNESPDYIERLLGGIRKVYSDIDASSNAKGHVGMHGTQSFRVCLCFTRCYATEAGLGVISEGRAAEADVSPQYEQ